MPNNTTMKTQNTQEETKDCQMTIDPGTKTFGYPSPTQEGWEKELRLEVAYLIAEVVAERDESRIANVIESVDKALTTAHEDGRQLELNILERHINKQIYQNTISTDSLLRYIEQARTHLANNTK